MPYRLSRQMYCLRVSLMFAVVDATFPPTKLTSAFQLYPSLSVNAGPPALMRTVDSVAAEAENAPALARHAVPAITAAVEIRAMTARDVVLLGRMSKQSA